MTDLLLIVGLFLNGLGIVILSRRFDNLTDKIYEFGQKQNEYFVSNSGIKKTVSEIKALVKKGNKDQQEIKTRLTWDKKRDKKFLKKISGYKIDRV